MKQYILLTISIFCLSCAFVIFGTIYYIINYKPKRICPYYVELQIEEPLSKGDILRVLDITKGEKDTIWVGYFH